jgi:serine/threonine protein kinase
MLTTAGWCTWISSRRTSCSWGGEPRLSDWGTAKTLLYESLTRSRFTPEYAAPEQLDPEYGEPDWQTDIYQLGVVLYEMLMKPCCC